MRMLHEVPFSHICYKCAETRSYPLNFWRVAEQKSPFPTTTQGGGSLPWRMWAISNTDIREFFYRY